MTIHITGQEFGALIKAINDMKMQDLITVMQSEELWVTIRQIEGGVYNIVITNQIETFQD